MFRKIEDFVAGYGAESQSTQKVLAALTDASLQQAVAPGHQQLGRMAWHIVLTIPEMMKHVGLAVVGPSEQAPVPSSASQILEEYRQASASLLAQVKKTWTNESLLVTDNLYGETWERGKTLTGLIAHEVHHRGQMTVLMRQAGLKVPGVYGPAQEEWAQYGMAAQE